MTTRTETKLKNIEPSQRILLLPHCLRRANTCQGKYNKQGLECHQCTPDCAINLLQEAALNLGYKGVCVAPGGKLAVEYVKEIKPGAIVAVACDKELKEGIREVKELVSRGLKPIPIVIIPLQKDGCVDTEVDVELALEKITLGCVLPVRGR